MDDESSKFKQIKSKEELEKVKVKFYKAWDKRHIPDLRHIIFIRNTIKKHNNFIEHEVLVNIIMKKYGFKNRIVNKMLTYMVDNEIINDIFWENNVDLRYFINEE